MVIIDRLNGLNLPYTNLSLCFDVNYWNSEQLNLVAGYLKPCLFLKQYSLHLSVKNNNEN